MRLPGRLSRTTLGDLLGALYRAGVDGVLELKQDAERRHEIHLRHGQIVHVDSQLGSPRLGELLSERAGNQLGPELAARLGQDDFGSLSVGLRALRMGLVGGHVVSRALHEQARKRLDALFLLEEADIRFHPPRRPRAVQLPCPPLRPVEFLHGRQRRRDRLSDTVRTDGARPAPRLRALAVLGLGPQATAEDVRLAFRRLAAAWHPDRLPVGSERERQRAGERFAELSQAFHALSA